MPTQTYSQIYKSLGGIYNPQVNLIRQRQSALPGQIQAEESALGAKQTQAYDEILGGARRRGLGFSGIPLQEQAKYNSTEYMPALARLKQSGREQVTSLEEAILGTRERQAGMARGIHEGVMSRMMANKQMAEQRRQFNASLARSGGGGGGGFSPSFGDLGLGGGGGGNGAGFGMKKRSDGSYAFVDPSGKAVSAAVYAAATGTSFRSLLDRMAKGGDKGASTALGFVGDDFGYNPNKIGQNAALYNALTWGAMDRIANTRNTINGSSW